MATLNSSNFLERSKQTLPLFLALIAAGLVGNYFKFPIFLNIDFLFGSIFAMLVLQFFGLGRGILAGAIIACYTWFLWNHPYAIIVLTAEVAVVGWLMERRKMGMVLADTLYWLIIGMPLVYLFYHLVMHVPPSNTYIVMTKQAVNGIANALVARLIFTGFTLRSRSSLTSYREIVYNMLAFFVLCPTLILLALGSRTDFTATDLRIRTLLMQEIKQDALRLETWILNRKSAILNLAEMVASRSPQQMQPYLEQAKKSDLNFLRIGLLDREATTTAYFPLIDELGHSNIGNNFADRPFMPEFKRTLKPMLTEAVIGRVGTPKPIVLMLAPVIIRGEYSGYVAGTLSLEQIREYMDKSADENSMLYTLLDKNGNIIMTNRTDRKVMSPFGRGQGSLNLLDDKRIRQWVPTLPPNIPISERWKQSFYVAETAIGDLAEWKLILEQPVAPFQKTLYENYTGKLTLLFLILLGALALAEFLSRKIAITLEQLRMLTHALPLRLATDGQEITWPESGIKEANHLISHFREMADSLLEQFLATRQINESLEQRVEERTEALKLSNERLADAQIFARIGNWEADLSTNELYWSQVIFDIFGFDSKSFKPSVSAFHKAVHPDDKSIVLESEKRSEQTGLHDVVHRIIRPNGEVRFVHELAKRYTDDNGNLVKLRGTVQDITERGQAEEKIRQANILLDSIIENIPNTIFLKDAKELRFTLFNRAGRN